MNLCDPLRHNCDRGQSAGVNSQNGDGSTVKVSIPYNCHCQCCVHGHTHTYFPLCKQMAKPYDFLFKLVLVGDMGVGKTSVLARYAEDTFTITSTLGELLRV